MQVEPCVIYTTQLYFKMLLTALPCARFEVLTVLLLRIQSLIVFWPVELWTLGRSTMPSSSGSSSLRTAWPWWWRQKLETTLTYIVWAIMIAVGVKNDGQSLKIIHIAKYWTSNHSIPCIPDSKSISIQIFAFSMNLKMYL